MNVSSPQIVIGEVRALLERRRTAQAKARLKGALQEHPDHPELLLQSAWADYLDDDNAAALQTVQQVLVSDPHSHSARLLLFELEVENGKFPDAELIIIALLRESPEHAPYYARYAELMMRTMRLPKARALAEEGLRSDPDNAGCLAALALCDFIEQRPGATSHSLQQLLVRYPQSSRTLLLILVALQDRGDHCGAYRIAQELVRSQPDHKPYIQIAADLKATSHWSMLPLWPLMRWGWAASIGLWVLGIGAVRVLGQSNPAAAGILGLCIFAYAVYSWVWPPLLRRWMGRV
jgi:tetratricopeptide (TPR) repeat protein